MTFLNEFDLINETTPPSTLSGNTLLIYNGLLVGNVPKQ